MITTEPKVIITITAVQRKARDGDMGYFVTGKVGFREKVVFVEDEALAAAIGNDPAHYTLVDLTPTIAGLAFPTLAEFFNP